MAIIGRGLISIESTEALISKKCKMGGSCQVTVIEVLPQILSILDEEMALLVQRRMEANGVRVLTGEKVLRFETSNGRVSGVVTGSGVIPVDFVVVATGVKPNVQLAEEAGLQIGSTGAIKTDLHLRTSDPDIYAAGDCVENRCMICNHALEVHVPLGSTANKHGRVAAINACGGNEVFRGIYGTRILKIFDYNVGRTGLSEREARREGFDVETVIAPNPDRAHYYPTAKPVIIKLVADRQSQKLLGIQAVGPGDVSKRIDIAVAALSFGSRLDEISNMDLGYAPPFSSASDPFVAAVNCLRNKMAGFYRGMGPAGLKACLDGGEDLFLLDVRSPAEFEATGIPGGVLVPLGALRGRLDELPRDKEIVAYCKSSLRAYEASTILEGAGFNNITVLDGGVDAWPYEKRQGPE